MIGVVAKAASSHRPESPNCTGSKHCFLPQLTGIGLSDPIPFFVHAKGRRPGQLMKHDFLCRSLCRKWAVELRGMYDGFGRVPVCIVPKQVRTIPTLTPIRMGAAVFFDTIESFISEWHTGGSTKGVGTGSAFERGAPPREIATAFGHIEMRPVSHAAFMPM